MTQKARAVSYLTSRKHERKECQSVEQVGHVLLCLSWQRVRQDIEYTPVEKCVIDGISLRIKDKIDEQLSDGVGNCSK